jgi:hypothetical protein
VEDEKPWYTCSKSHVQLSCNTRLILTLRRINYQQIKKEWNNNKDTHARFFFIKISYNWTAQYYLDWQALHQAIASIFLIKASSVSIDSNWCVYIYQKQVYHSHSSIFTPGQTDCRPICHLGEKSRKVKALSKHCWISETKLLRCLKKSNKGRQMRGKKKNNCHLLSTRPRVFFPLVLSCNGLYDKKGFPLARFFQHVLVWKYFTYSADLSLSV